MLNMKYYIAVVSTMIVVCEMSMAGDKRRWSPDINGVCKVESTQLSCPIYERGKLPILRSGDAAGKYKEWQMVKISCQPSSSGVFDINLSSSVFSKNFGAGAYEFDFKHCNFNLPPDLFDNIVLNLASSKAKYSLTFDLSYKSYIPNMSFNKASSDITIKRYRGDMGRLKTALKKSKVVKLMLYLIGSPIPAGFFTHMTGLREIDVNVPRCLPFAFWKLSLLTKLWIATHTLLPKSLYEIGRIDKLYIRGPTKLLHNGSIHSISSIGNVDIHVNHDAFEGQTFYNVAEVHWLRLGIYPHVRPDCTKTSAECDVRFDFARTKIRMMTIAMNKVLFVLPSSDIYGTLQLGKLSIEIRMIEKYTTDQWVNGSFILSAIKDIKRLSLWVAHVYPNGRRINSITCFPLNFTNSVLKTVWFEIQRGFRNPVCDSSWLTLSRTTEHLTLTYFADMKHIPYPLIIRSPQLSGKLRVRILENGPSSKFVHCICSISWLKQLMDCNPVPLDRTWLDLPCSFDHSITVDQFLNSTICCKSTDPPTLNNEPNMPMKCNQFLPIPPELLYFNHADLPQCRSSSTNSWEFNSCNVSAFYRKYILAQSGTGGNEANCLDATNNSAIVIVLLVICAIANIAFIVVCLCWWKRSFLKRQHNHFLAWRSKIVILENEKLQYVCAINNNVDMIVSVINLEEMIERGRNKMIMDDCGEEKPLIGGNDFNDINELDHSDQVIQFLEKVENKSVVVIRWFLIQLIRDGHNNVVERIVDEVKSKKVDPEENKAGDMALNDL